MHAITSFSCHRAAVFSDIHSNYYAFSACYEDALSCGADLFIFLGDYISDLADPVKTLDLVYDIKSRFPTICLRGNRERYMTDHEKGLSVFSRSSKTGSLLFTFDQLRSHDLDFIRNLPIYCTAQINGVQFELAHAAKDDDRFYFQQNDKTIPQIFSQMQQNYLLTGHSHKQYIQHFQEKTIINPGSIGVPQGGNPLSQYALLDIADGSVQCLLRQVPYDLSAAVHAQFENGLADYAPYWAISILYDIMSGREYTMQLLDHVNRRCNAAASTVYDESLWRSAAAELGMKFTEQEIIDHLTSHVFQDTT